MKNDLVFTLHLFAGAGGGLLADLILGHFPIGAVEIDSFARKVLLSRQADGSIPFFPIWDDIRSFRIDNPDTAEYIKRLRSINGKLCICGGFPCQDISCAGKHAGIKGKRSGLWSEFARTICEVRPRYAFLENSPLLVHNGIDVIINDLAELGYALAWGVVSAKDVGAAHLRKRFWGVAKREVPNPNVQHRKEFSIGSNEKSELAGFEKLRVNISNSGSDGNGRVKCSEEMESNISDSMRSRNVKRKREQQENIIDWTLDGGGKDCNAFRLRGNFESRLDGMANGISDWLDEVKCGTLWNEDEKGIPRIMTGVKDKTNRLKCIGNAQVPLQAAVAFTILKDLIDQYV